MRTRFLGLVAVLALLGAACGAALPSTPPAASAGPPLGGTWTAVLVGGRVPVPGSEPRVQFTVGGRIEGTTGCNDFGGSYTVDGDRIRIRDLVQTEIGCPGDVGAIEAAFVRILAAAERAAVDGGRLRIAGGVGEVELTSRGAQLDEQAAAIARALGDGEWRVRLATGIEGLDAIPALTFADDQLLAAGGCGFAGTFRLLGGDRVSIRELSWDAAGCTPPDDRARADLATLLESAERIRLEPEGGRATIFGRAGEVVISR